jgi:putative SOS response-associated peptidase YedK
VIAERFGVHYPRGFAGPGTDTHSALTTPRYNIAPTQTVIVVNDTGDRQLVPMRWGLIPSWAKDPSIGNRMINARAESIAEKPAFRAALKRRRCIIPADGFYEWQRTVSSKQPVRIVLKSREPFGFAGLWEHWTSPTGEEVLSCTIITTEVNELLREVHHRMPAILPREAEAAWLDPKVQDTETLLALLKPYPSEAMEYYPVDRLVNSPANDVPQCIIPVQHQPPSSSGSQDEKSSRQRSAGGNQNTARSACRPQDTAYNPRRMDAPEFFSLAGGHAVYRPVAHLPLPRAIEMVSGVITYATENQIDRLLVDTTRLTGFDPPLTWERFRMAERFARAARGAAIKIALVALPQMVDPERFGVTVAHNRGLLANVFTSEPPAVAWLLDPNAR